MLRRNFTNKGPARLQASDFTSSCPRLAQTERKLFYGRARHKGQAYRPQSVARSNCKYQLSSTRYKPAISSVALLSSSSCSFTSGAHSGQTLPWLHQYLTHAALQLHQSPHTQGKRGAKVKSSPFKVLGVFRLNSNAKFFYIIPGHFFILLSAILFVPALPQMHKFCERRKNVYSLWRFLKNQKRK